MLAEINPLVITAQGDLLALDAKLGQHDLAGRAQREVDKAARGAEEALNLLLGRAAELIGAGELAAERGRVELEDVVAEVLDELGVFAVLENRPDRDRRGFLVEVKDVVAVMVGSQVQEKDLVPGGTIVVADKDAVLGVVLVAKLAPPEGKLDVALTREVEEAPDRVAPVQALIRFDGERGYTRCVVRARLRSRRICREPVTLPVRS